MCVKKKLRSTPVIPEIILCTHFFKLPVSVPGVFIPVAMTVPCQGTSPFSALQGVARATHPSRKGAAEVPAQSQEFTCNTKMWCVYIYIYSIYIVIYMCVCIGHRIVINMEKMKICIEAMVDPCRIEMDGL